MVNHPNRSTRFDIVAYADGRPVSPWFIRIDPGSAAWPELLFPFQMKGAGTDEGERCARAAARAALKAAALFYSHDETGSFAPSLTLLRPDRMIVRQLPVVRTN